jgi:hypothetical protein
MATAEEKLVRGRIVNAKSFGWVIYAAGFAIRLFGYLKYAARWLAERSAKKKPRIGARRFS